MKGQTILLAPAKEQERIVAKLDELFSDIEAGEKALERARALVLRYRQSVLKAAVTGELTREWREKNLARLKAEKKTGADLLAEILKKRREAWEAAELAKMRAKGKEPRDDKWKARYQEPLLPDVSTLPQLPEGWVWSSLGQLFRVSVGTTPSRAQPSFWGGNVPWVSSGEVAFCRIYETRETITQEGLGNAATRLHPSGTVLLAMIGEGKTRGQAAILHVPAAHNQNCASIRVSETAISPEFVFHFLHWRYEETRRGSQGGNQPALNKELVEAICIPVPPFDEMQLIVDSVEEEVTKIEATLSVLTQQLTRASLLRQSALSVAFSGKLVPQDPADEPASELLARIRVDREQPKRSATNRSNPASKSRKHPATSPSSHPSLFE